MERPLEWLRQDLQFAIHSLNRDRRFTLLAILALALGIGSVTVIFSAVYGVLIDTFPYAHFDRMVNFRIESLGPQHRVRTFFSITEILDFRDQNDVFEDMEGGTSGTLHYIHGNQTTQWSVTRETATGYQFFGVKPLLGRLIVPPDTKPGAPPVFMMSYQLWKEQFNRDPGILGKTFNLNGKLWTLVGIMPPRFRLGWTDIFTAFPNSKSEVAKDPTLKNAYIWPLGFLKPGVTIAQAGADLNLLAHRRAKVHPEEYPKQFHVTARSFQAAVNPMFESVLYPLLYAVLLLFLIACTNVANLLLSRGSSRDREIAMRAALGATRWRLVRQLLVESFVLAVAGCAAGCFLAYLGVKELVPLIPYANFPQEAVIRLNWIVLLAALGLAILATILCGLVPAIRAVGGPLQPRLVGSGMGANAGARHGKLRDGFVVAEVALSLVLLVGAGLMLRTFFSMTHVGLGYNSDRVLFVNMGFPPGPYDTATQRKLFFDELLAKVRRLPGVLDVAQALSPFGGFYTPMAIPGATHQKGLSARANLVGRKYFRIFDHRLLLGRTFNAEDLAAQRHVAVVDKTFARKFLPKGNPLGQKIDFAVYDRLRRTIQNGAAGPVPGLRNKAPAKTYFNVVGVVSNVKLTGMEQQPQPQAFLPCTVAQQRISGMVVRTAGDADEFSGKISQQIWSMDHDIDLSNDRGSIQSLLQKFLYAKPEFEFVMLSTFAGVGLLLVVIGTYSVMAYNVSLQTREIGIRMALGAQRGDVLRQVLWRGGVLLGIGIALGLFGAWGVTRLIRNQLWGVEATDPWTFAGVTVIVVLAGLLACAGPARRATQVDPIVALREE